MSEKAKLFADRDESVSKVKVEAYKQLADAAKGRLESEIPLGDNYWAVRAQIHYLENNNLWESVTTTKVVDKKVH